MKYVLWYNKIKTVIYVEILKMTLVCVIRLGCMFHHVSHECLCSVQNAYFQGKSVMLKKL